MEMIFPLFMIISILFHIVGLFTIFTGKYGGLIIMLVLLVSFLLLFLVSLPILLKAGG
ncbi:MAG TPA: hypothetical protein VFC79_00185 [Tissierellaceae bacterium]|nr:hypothetical protein [Tissierellaceae bacterium]